MHVKYLEHLWHIVGTQIIVISKRVINKKKSMGMKGQKENSKI